MKVKEIMTENAKVCTWTTNLADAARLMWDGDCGILPVVAEGGKVVGLITDRDICMAAVMKNRHLENIAVEEVSSGRVFACKPEDHIETALKTMQEKRVRRLPVLHEDGMLAGMLSMDDIMVNAKDGANKKAPGVNYDDVVTAYKGICANALVHQRKTPAMTAVV